MLVYFDGDSQTVFAEEGTKLLLNQICLSGSCFGNSDTIISVQTKITRITELLFYQVFSRYAPTSSQNIVSIVL